MSEQVMAIMFDFYVWVKAFHLIAVIFWMAGLLYLPRLFVYHHQSKSGGELETKMIEGYNSHNLTTTIWLPVKFLLVFLLMGYHVFLSKQRKLFASGQRPKSEKFFRRINEIPAIFTIIIVVMVIVKPF